MLSQEEMQRRKIEVIRAIVQEHIATGLPIGSNKISNYSSGILSRLGAATVRYIMAELEETGYLSKPHTSAGRLPTDRAYRLYVNEIQQSSSPNALVKKRILRRLKLEASDVTGKSVAKVSRLLSQVSHNVGMALGPNRSENLLEHVKLIKMSDRRILAVIVSKPDLVENKIIHIDEEMSQADLDQAANYLNANFQGWTLNAVHGEIHRRLLEDRRRYKRLKRQLALLVQKAILPGHPPPELFVDGTVSIIEQVEFQDFDRAKTLLATLTEKEKLAKILTACMQSPSKPIQVVIGHENTDQGMKGCTIVMAPYLCGDRVIGALGVLGPTRMEYDRAITVVRYTAQVLSKALNAN